MTRDSPHYLPPEGHLSFPLLAESLIPQGALHKRENQHKTGHRSSGDVTLTLRHPSLISESPSPARPGGKCGNITLVIASGHDYVPVTADKDLLGISHRTLIAFKT